MSNWTDRLYRASWRGIPFAVTAGQSRFGRKTAVHEYPFRDTVWVEDIGRGTRRLTVTGFIVENSLVYGGGDVLYQKQQMIGAAETPGPGRLIHPTLGEMMVALIEFEVDESTDNGRSFGLRFGFVDAGQRIYPAQQVSTTDQTNTAADSADAESLAILP